MSSIQSLVNATAKVLLALQRASDVTTVGRPFPADWQDRLRAVTRAVSNYRAILELCEEDDEEVKRFCAAIFRREQLWEQSCFENVGYHVFDAGWTGIQFEHEIFEVVRQDLPAPEEAQADEVDVGDDVGENSMYRMLVSAASLIETLNQLRPLDIQTLLRPWSATWTQNRISFGNALDDLRHRCILHDGSDEEVLAFANSIVDRAVARELQLRQAYVEAIERLDEISGGFGRRIVALPTLAFGDDEGLEGNDGIQAEGHEEGLDLSDIGEPQGAPLVNGWHH